MKRVNDARRRAKVKISFLDSSKRKDRCRWGFFASFVTVDGYVTPCCIRQDPDIINFGNVFEKDFTDIWNGSKMQEFRRKRLVGEKDPICEFCPD